MPPLRAQCPQVLKKYGWCAVLACVYACGIAMPTSEDSFTALLDTFKRDLGVKKPSWKKTDCVRQMAHRGGMKPNETAAILRLYGVDYVRRSAGLQKQTVRRWLKDKQPGGAYILLTGKHALFVDVPEKGNAWRIYDQSGGKTVSDNARSMRLRVRVCFTLYLKRDAAAPAAQVVPAAATAIHEACEAAATKLFAWILAEEAQSQILQPQSGGVVPLIHGQKFGELFWCAVEGQFVELSPAQVVDDYS